MTNLNELIKNNTVVILDIETTGLCPDGDKADKIYEISARKIIDENISNTLFLYRDDKLKIDRSVIGLMASVYKVDGDKAIAEYGCMVLSDDYDIPLLFVGSSKLLLEASNIKSAVKKLKRFIGKGILCGYDCELDLKFLSRYQAFDDIQTVDLLPIVKATIGDKVKNLELNTVCEFLGIDVNKKSHVTLTAELLLKLANDNI